MLDFIKTHVLEAGEICRQRQQTLTAADSKFKGPKDLVTDVDREVEEYLVARIRKNYPDHTIIREEGDDHVSDSPYTWVIDPIDGTTSFAHGQPYYSISVALMYQGASIGGVIYGPALGQLFHAERGKGAFLNDAQITVSSTSALISSVLATGFACMRDGWEDNNLIYFTRLLPRIRDIRRCGSAALDMAYVAAGKYDGFWELNLNLYDIAAGTILVEEAGGVVCDFKGGEHFPEKGIVAANPQILESIRTLLS